MTREAKASLMGQQWVTRTRGWTEPESSWTELHVPRAWVKLFTLLSIITIINNDNDNH